MNLDDLVKFAPVILGVLLGLLTFAVLVFRRSNVMLGTGSDRRRYRADATAFVPKAMAVGSPELIQIFVNRPKDHGVVRSMATQTDKFARRTGGVQKLGWVQKGAVLSVVVDATSADVCALGPSHKVWNGKPLRFAFTVTAQPQAKSIVVEARLLLDGAQIGSILFSNPVAKVAAVPEGRVEHRMSPINSVFISYSSRDREQVALVAGAYARAGVKCFFDRTSLRSGEEWPVRLLDEIRDAELFHLFWSQSASESQWVEKETRHALSIRQSSSSSQPRITIQMLDGPPWAPHPPDLNHLNFDDFWRAAIVGYKNGASGSAN